VTVAMSLAAPLHTFDPRRLRNVLGSFTTGVVIVTSVGDEGRPIGLTVNSFNSVSMQPPLILWSLALKSPSLNAFRTHNWFAVNILAEDQEPLCRQFATSSDDKFANVKFDVGQTGVPVLHGTAAYLECSTYARYPGGDHEIYLGEVRAMHDRGLSPLVFHRGAIRRLGEH
jgi:flavin reductase (DIM6/NTAB) family NADH-FMN oxidoreductase RutF